MDPATSDVNHELTLNLFYIWYVISSWKKRIKYKTNFIWKLEHLKGDWGWKSRPNFALFTRVKVWEWGANHVWVNSMPDLRPNHWPTQCIFDGEAISCLRDQSVDSERTAAKQKAFDTRRSAWQVRTCPVSDYFRV